MSLDLEEYAYFDSYSDLNVHRTMLNDTQRLLAYKRAIFANTEFWKGKSVLDVGAGTGVLSVYCAQAGADKVYAVEANKNLFDILNDVIEENKVETVVEPVSGRVEDVDLKCRVDVIVSEWMGHYLLHESMLDSVLFARDKYLKPDGLLFPNSCRLYAAPCSLPTYFDHWLDVTGVSMRSFSRALRRHDGGCSEITTVSSDWLFSARDYEDFLVYELNLNDVLTVDLDKIETRSFTVAERDGKLQGACVWFDVSFPIIDDRASEIIRLSTSPFDLETHWKQFVVVFPIEIPIERDCPIVLSLTLERHADNTDDDRRKYNVSFEIMDPDDVIHPDDCKCIASKCLILRECQKNIRSVSAC